MKTSDAKYLLSLDLIKTESFEAVKDWANKSFGIEIQNPTFRKQTYRTPAENGKGSEEFTYWIVFAEIKDLPASLKMPSCFSEKPQDLFWPYPTYPLNLRFRLYHKHELNSKEKWVLSKQDEFAVDRIELGIKIPSTPLGNKRWTNWLLFWTSTQKIYIRKLADGKIQSSPYGRETWLFCRNCHRTSCLFKAFNDVQDWVTADSPDLED